MTVNPTPPVRRRPGRPRHEQPSDDYLRRREEIIDTAVKVFRLKGYDAGSLDDVAVALGLRKASLYYYVRSKAELLYLVFDRAITGALEAMEVIASTVAPAEQLSRLLRHQISTVASDPSLFAVFFDQRPRLDRDYEEAIRAKERRYLQLFVQAVETSIATGAIRASDPRHAAQLLLGMATWTYKWYDPAHDDVSAIADAAVRLVLIADADDEATS